MSTARQARASAVDARDRNSCIAKPICWTSASSTPGSSCSATTSATGCRSARTCRSRIATATSPAKPDCLVRRQPQNAAEPRQSNHDRRALGRRAVVARLAPHLEHSHRRRVSGCRGRRDSVRISPWFIATAWRRGPHSCRAVADIAAPGGRQFQDLRSARSSSIRRP